MLLSPLPASQIDLTFLPPMPTKTQIFDPDFPEDDEDDDLPPLVEAPCADADDEAIDPPTFQLTFTRNMTPSFFGAPSDASASVSALVSDAPSPSPPPPIPQHPPGLVIPPRSISIHRQRGDEAVVMASSMKPRGRGRATGISVEPPSPSIADAGSPSPSPALSPVAGHERTYPQVSTGSLSLSSTSLDLDAVREPASGPQRTSAATAPGDLLSPGGATNPGSVSIAAGQMVMGPPTSMGMGMGAARPPSYIPRPPNAFILFRAAFVRTHKLGADGTAVPNSASAAASMGISALDPSTSVTTITPAADPSPASTTGGKKSRGAAGGGKGENLGGSTATLSKLAGQLWRSLAPDERVVWEDKARAAQAEHRKKYPDWRFRPENASGVLGADDWGGGGGSGGGPGGAGRGGGWVVLGAAGASFAGPRGGGGKKGKKKANRAATVLDLPTWATENMGFEEKRQDSTGAKAEAKESRSDAGVYRRESSPGGAGEDGQAQKQKRVTRSSSRSSRAVEKGKAPATDAHAAPTVTSTSENVSVQDSGAGSGTSSITIRPPPSSRCSPTTTYSELASRMSVADENGNGEEKADPEDQSDPGLGSNSWFASIPLTAIHRRAELALASASTSHPPQAELRPQAQQPPPLSISNLQVQTHDQTVDSTSPASTQGIPPLIPSTSVGAPMHFVPRGGLRLLAHEFEFSGDFFAGSPGSPAPPSAHSIHSTQSTQAAQAPQQSQRNEMPVQDQAQAQIEMRSKSQSRSLTRQQQQRSNSGVVRTRSFTHGRARPVLGAGAGGVRGRTTRAYAQPQVQIPAQPSTQAQPLSASGHGELASPPPLSPALSSPISGGSSSHYSFGHAHSAHSVHSGLGGNGSNTNQRFGIGGSGGGGGLVSPSSHSNPAMGSNLFVVPSRFPPPPPRAHTRTAGEMARAATAPELSVNIQQTHGQSQNSQSQADQNSGMVSPGPIERIEPGSLGYALGPAAYEAAGMSMSAGYSELANWDGIQQVHQQTQQPRQQIQILSSSDSNNFAQSQAQVQMSPTHAQTQQASPLSLHQNQNQQQQQQQQHPKPQQVQQTYPTGASTLSAFNGGPSGSSATAQPSFFAHMPSFSTFQPFSLGFGGTGMGVGTGMSLGAQTPSTAASMSPNLATVSYNSSSSGVFDPSGTGGGGYAYSPTVEASSGQEQNQLFGNVGVGSGMGYANDGTMNYYGFHDQQQSQSQQTSPSSSHDPVPSTNANTSTYSPFAPASLQGFLPYPVASNPSTSANAHANAAAYGAIETSYLTDADSFQSFGMNHFDHLDHIDMVGAVGGGIGGIGGLSAVGGGPLDATWSAPIGLAATFNPSAGNGSGGHRQHGHGYRQEGRGHGHEMGKH